MAQSRVGRQVSLGRERISIMPIMNRVIIGGTGDFFSEPVTWYQVNNPMFRTYLKEPGLDEHVNFRFSLEFYVVGVPEITLPILGTETPTPLAGVFGPSQDGAPVQHEVKALKNDDLEGATHVRVKMTVTQWDLTFDMPVIVELWANAWRRRRQPRLGVNVFDPVNGQDNLNQEGLDINRDLITSRETLR